MSNLSKIDLLFGGVCCITLLQFSFQYVIFGVMYSKDILHNRNTIMLLYSWESFNVLKFIVGRPKMLISHLVNSLDTPSPQMNYLLITNSFEQI